MLARLVAALLRHRIATTLALALVVLVAAAGVLRLHVDFSSRAFYGGDAEAAERLTEHQAIWGADDDLVFVLVHTDGEDPEGVLSRPRLEAIAELAESLARVEGVARTGTIARQLVPRPALLPGEGETIEFVELAERAHLAELGPELRRPLLEQMPFVPALLARDGRDTLIVVELAFSSDDVMRTEAVVGELRERVIEHAPALAERGLDWELAGVAAIRAGFFALVVHDQSRFIPLTLLLIGLSLFAVFRRWHAVLIPAIAAGLPTLMLVGIMGWTGESIGLLNQAYFTLLPVIAVADAIHMVARVHEELANDPEHDRERAIAVAVQRVGLACFLTSLTTAVGFGSLAFASMPILRSFGLYAALGVSLAFVLVLVVVPLLLSRVPVERLRADDRRSLSDGLVRGCVGLATRRPWTVLLSALLLSAAALPAAARVEIDNRLVDLLEPEDPVARASARVDAELGGSLGLEFDVILPQGATLDDPELLERLLGFERWLLERDEVRSVEGLAGMIAALEGDRSIPRERDQVDARMAELAVLIPLDRLVAPGRTRLRAGLPDLGGRAFSAFAVRAEAELQTRMAGTGVEVHATGTPLLAYRGVNGITSDLRSSFSLVFAVILVVIALVFRSLGPALLALPVNAMPLLLGYASIGVIGMVLDPLAAVILTLALGIAVDDTLHVMVRVREELELAGDVRRPDRAARRAALDRAMQHSGRAVVITSIVVAGGLALNCFSSFPPLQLLGLLGSSVLVLALFANLLVLPALIVVIGRR
ncbi:efflux RND transporter permease subunit [Nannocystaceae bacterium ST9]